MEYIENHPLPPLQFLLWGLSLLSVAFYNVDGINPNHTLSQEQASSRPVAEESPWQQKCGLYRTDVLFTTVCLKKKQWKERKYFLLSEDLFYYL